MTPRIARVQTPAGQSSARSTVAVRSQSCSPLPAVCCPGFPSLRRPGRSILTPPVPHQRAELEPTFPLESP
jgi:hypothetical protein